MDPTLGLERICLGKNIYGSSGEKVEGHVDWNALEYTNTANSKENKVTKALSFYKIETDKVSEWYIAPCFVNSLEAYDGEINLKLDENLISNEYVVKLCLYYEVKKGNKGELYYDKFIINPKKDNVEPGVIFGRSFIRLVNGTVDFASRMITFYPKGDPFEDDYEKTEKTYDGEINLKLDENLISNEYVVKLCLYYEVKKGNKVVKKELIVALKGELYYDKFIINPKKDNVEPGVIFGRSFIRLVNGTVDFASGMITFYPKGDPFEDDYEKTEKRHSRIRWNDYERRGGSNKKSQRKVLDEIWKDIVELDGMIMKEEEEAINKVKGEALKEKDDPEAFIFSIRLEGKVNKNALPDTGETFLNFNGVYHQTFRATRSDVIRTVKSDSNDKEEYEIKNKFGAPIYDLKPAASLNCHDPTERLLALKAVINLFRKISVWKKTVSFLGSLPVSLQHVSWKPDYKGCYTNEEEAKGHWRTEIMVTDPYGNIFTMGGNDDEVRSSRSKRSRQNETVEDVLLPQVHHEFLL
nr:hypothetical protein [Tanacetum cinerariifolium]